MLTNTIEILKKAKKGGYAVGAFNTSNLEITQGILEAAEEMRSPVIVQMTESTLNYAGGRTIFALVKSLAEHYAPDIPVGIHLDHGKSFEVIRRAVEIGFTSVMYDASRKDYKDNLKETSEIVKYCHKKGVKVQGELGNVPYLHEANGGDVDWDLYMTNPEQAKEFVEKTGIDSLAVAIGNAHGFFKEREVPDWARLKKIKSLIDVPIVLHGGSDWEQEKAYNAIEDGVSCFNVDTAIRLAFTAKLSSMFKKDTDVSMDPRKVMGEVREAVKRTVSGKIRNFKSWNKA